MRYIAAEMLHVIRKRVLFFCFLLVENEAVCKLTLKL